MQVSLETKIWLDGSSILRSGISLDYSRVRELVQAKLENRQTWAGRYYDSALSDSNANLSRAEDREQLCWQREEQQRAQTAGFALHLSPAWCERLRCLFCSCLNAVHYPAPPLLDLYGDLQADLSPSDHSEYSEYSPPQIFLLSDNPALLFALSKIRSGGSSLLQQSALRLLCMEDGNLELLQKHSKAWPAAQQQVLEAKLQNAIQLEEIEWLED